ncbi:MAG: hypothetical protein ACXVIP_05325 [Halobacteriota archaeon]
MAQEQDPEKKKRQIKQVLHEPISPYVTDSFNTITHLGQGVTLAALFYIITIQTEFDLLTAGKLVVLFLGIGFIWHLYLTSNQFVGWRPRIQDTLHPIALAIAECLLVVSIHQPIYVFAFFFTLILVIFIFAASFAITGNSRPEAVELFREHFKAQGELFADEFRLETISIYKRFLAVGAILVPVFYLVTAALYVFSSLSDVVASYAFLALCYAFFIVMFRFDYIYYLNHSETLKKYGYRW